MDEFQAARVVAAFNVFARHNYKASDPNSPQPSPDYLLRRIHRKCCQILNASIAEVERMPLDALLAHYYEHAYDELSEAEGEEAAERWAEEIALLTETDEERSAREATRAADERGTDRFLEETKLLNEREVRIKPKANGDGRAVDLEARARRLKELAERTGAKMGISRKY